jgi:iron complex outermembrane recepter protein
MRSPLKIFACGLVLAASCLSVMARQDRSDPGKNMDLTAMNIEDLMNIKVTSVSKTEQKLSRTASAVFVIEREDIQHSGALNIPDLLRMVPGVEVAQITSNTWAIGVRGFNSRFSNKLLVMLDGRAVYTPSFGGVFWDTLDVPLGDIERIEVIRGPGGSVWGANAVDGVVNIITRKSSETQGTLVTSGGGNINQGFGTVQYGGTLAKEKIDYRIYSKYSNQNHLPDEFGRNGGDGWQMLQGGFRADATLSSNDTLAVQGNLYTGDEHNPAVYLLSITPPNAQFIDAAVNVSGGYLQSVWNHEISSRSGTTLDVSYTSYRRNDVLEEGRKTLTVDFQHHFLWGDRQDIIWGWATAIPYRIPPAIRRIR